MLYTRNGGLMGPYPYALKRLLAAIPEVGGMQRELRRKSLNAKSTIAPMEMPGLDGHLCFALYAASNHMTRLFVPFLQKLGVTYPPVSGSRRALGAWSARRGRPRLTATN